MKWNALYLAIIAVGSYCRTWILSHLLRTHCLFLCGAKERSLVEASRCTLLAWKTRNTRTHTHKSRGATCKVVEQIYIFFVSCRDEHLIFFEHTNVRARAYHQSLIICRNAAENFEEMTNFMLLISHHHHIEALHRILHCIHVSFSIGSCEGSKEDTNKQTHAEANCRESREKSAKCIIIIKSEVYSNMI